MAGSYTIVLVVSLVLALIILITVGGPVAAFIKQELEALFRWGSSYIATPFENAARCSYYRCVEGCGSQSVKKITTPFNCEQTFCEEVPEAFKSTDGKESICGW